MTTNRYLVAAAAFCTTLLLAWAAAGPLLHLPGRQFWILFTGLGAIGALGSGAWLWFVSNKSSDSAQAENATEKAPDSKDVALLIKEAEATLARASKPPLRNLPLFIVMGESESAKTSTILHSGLNVELLAGQVEAPTGVAKTKVANLWLSNGVVFAEAGGAVLSDTSQWRSLIRRLQPAKFGSVMGKESTAPRAAIVCVDTQGLASRPEMEALARKLRGRLGDISQLLGIRFPVYILFTQLDRTPGFQEFVRNFSNEEASQVVGTTLPVVPYTRSDDQSRRIQSALDELFYSLASLRPEYLRRCHESKELPAIYEFPRNFSKLTPLITEFLVEISKPSELRESPFLRGFYFSGLRPVIETDNIPSNKRTQDRKESEYQDATSLFGVHTASKEPPGLGTATPTGRVVPQWVFLKQLFQNVLLGDRAAMSTSLSSSKTAFAQRLLLGAGMALCLIWLGFLTISFLNNRAIQSEISAAGVNLPVSTGQDTIPSPAQLEKMDRLRAALEKLTVYQQEGSPWNLHWGLYSADRLYTPAHRIYFHQLFQPLLFQSTQSALLNRMERLPVKPGPEDQFGPNYDTLKAYLITTSHHDKSTKEWLSPYLETTWMQGHPAGKDSEALIARQFDFYSSELRRENPYSSAEDGVVERTRAYLHAFNQFDRLYRLYLEQAGAGQTAINFNRLYPQSSVGAKHIVEAAYTKAGWAAMQSAIRKGGNTGEDWVLGKDTGRTDDPRQFQEQLRTRYLNDYIEEWRNFLRSAYVVPYASLSDAAKKLSLTAAGSSSPLLALMAIVSDNTSVDPEVAKNFEAAAAVVPAGKKADFLGPSNKPYMDGLVALQLSVEQAAANPSATNPFVQQSQTNAITAKGAGLQLAGVFPDDRVAKMNDTVKKLLLDPITMAEAKLSGTGAADLNEKGAAFCKECVALMTKYPFNPSAKSQATLEQMNHMFQPETGTMWTLYNQSLKQMMPLTGNTYVAQPAGPVTLTPSFVTFFNRAAGFSQAIYQGGPQPRLNFTMSSRGVDGINQIEIGVDAQTMLITPTSGAAQQFGWPAQEVNLKLGGVPYGGWTGPWSLFQFFGSADDHWIRSGNGYNVKWDLWITIGGLRKLLGVLRMDVNMNGAPPVFERGYFSGMTCPKTVAQ